MYHILHLQSLQQPVYNSVYSNNLTQRFFIINKLGVNINNLMALNSYKPHRFIINL
jgi:hypothetical protein